MTIEGKELYLMYFILEPLKTIQKQIETFNICLSFWLFLFNICLSFLLLHIDTIMSKMYLRANNCVHILNNLPLFIVSI